MNKLKLFLLSMTVCVMAYANDSRSGNMNYGNNRAPLIVKPYMELPLGTIKPTGWLEDQLLRMKDGMTGHLDELYPQVMGPRNGWLGGDGDVWERGPYWIDGLLPLAYVLNDKELKDKVQLWIEKTIESRKPNGYFGPDTDREPEAGLQRNNSHDWWPKMVMLKIMRQYYNATGDQRVITLLTDYFKYQLEELPKTPLDHWTYWGKQRGGDNLMVVYWLYNITGDKFLLELGDLIHQQTYNWTDIFYKGETIPRPFSMHCVNLAQGFKEPIIYYQKNQEQKQIDAVKRAVKDMRWSIGWPIGLFGGDEALHSGNPTQGSELCSAVEMMFSLESMFEITGDVQWADHLEKVAYNALPTQVTDNYDSRQYYQQLNQIRVSHTERNFVIDHYGTDLLFGLLTGYPCCTSNLHQGWPKFTQNLWYATEDNGVAALVYAPSKVKLKVANGIDVQWTEETNYPFDETITFKLTIPGKKQKTALFPLHLRIPAWCEGANIQINGIEWNTPGGNTIVKIMREWKSGDVVTLQLPMQVKIGRWYERSAAVERGPLVYALRIGEKWEKIQGDHKHENHSHDEWYYEVHPTTPWNYCLLENAIQPENIEKEFIVVKRDTQGKYPWNLENAPVEIKTKGKRMHQWTEYNGSAGPLPYSTQYQVETGPEEEITLIPYGCTTLRITEFPVTRK
ncbi:MAG: glycoside hydrolase family 127 protein [Dysgonamonadaceae bacterium]|nr:glycoside hydrolase family 127 protein [Dysgonamonadaceae bacterium]